MESVKNKDKMSHKILVGDCKEALKKLPSGSVQLAITSPPYNMGKNYRDSDDRKSKEEFYRFTKTWIKEVYRVISDGGKLCLNLPMNDTQNIAELHKKIAKNIGFKINSSIIWIKWNHFKNNFAVSKWKKSKVKYPFLPFLVNAYEIIYVFQKGLPKRFEKRDLKKDEHDEWKFDVWHVKPAFDPEHPAPFPIEIPKRLIKLFSCPKDTILDPFLGSGTTLKACAQTKRKGIGIELSKKYAELAGKRISPELKIEVVNNVSVKPITHKMLCDFLNLPQSKFSIESKGI